MKKKKPGRNFRVSREHQILVGLKTYTGRVTVNGLPYLDDLSEHLGFQVFSKERDELCRRRHRGR